MFLYLLAIREGETSISSSVRSDPTREYCVQSDSSGMRHCCAERLKKPCTRHTIGVWCSLYLIVADPVFVPYQPLYDALDDPHFLCSLQLYLIDS